MEKKIIRVAVQDLRFLAYTELVPLQGNLKELSEINYQRLRKQILELEFSEAIGVWDKGGKYYILSGTQRWRVVKQMVEAEGYACEPLPCCIVKAASLAEAKRKILSLASQYGTITTEGLYEFTEDLPAYSVDEMRADLSFPGIDFDAYEQEYYEEPTTASDGGAPADPPEVVRMVDRFVVPPFTILDARQGYWQKRKQEWLSLGMESEVGRDTHLTKGKMGPTKAKIFDSSLGRPKALMTGQHEGKNLYNELNGGTSIFDPVLCELAYRWFCPPKGKVLDPFAGGSVRGIVASKLGREYKGYDLSPMQVAANVEQGKKLCPELMPDWECKDSAQIRAKAKFDFLFSCPPYYDLEVYSEDDRDLSKMETYEKFLDKYGSIIAGCCNALKDNRFAVFVVGDLRDKAGLYRNFVSHTIEAFEEAGLALYNHAIFVTPVGNLHLRAGKFFTASRKLGKSHQDFLVFIKGSPEKAVEELGEIEVEAVEGATAQPQ